jgi:hypothetical protein
MRPLALLALLAASPAAAAEVVALLPATGANVPAGELAAATDVLRAHLERTGRYVVVLAPAPAPDREATAAEALAAARATGASLAATLRVSRLGAVGLARLAVYGEAGGYAPVHVDELPAKGPDDLDPVLQRMAQGLAAGTSARKLAEVDTVTEREADPGLYKQRTIARAFGLRLGSTFVLDRADPVAATGTLSGLGLVWHYDARTFLADLSADVQWSQTLDPSYHGHRDWLLALGLGAYYPFLRGDVAPYLGAGAAYVWSNLGGDGASGLAFRGAGGVILGRLSSLQVRVELDYVVNTFVERDGTGQVHRGHGPGLSLALVL